METEKNVTSRRNFLQKSMLATTGATLSGPIIGSLASGKVLGANDRVRVGFIGVGNRGSQLLERFMANKDVEVAALCDVYKPYTTRDKSEVDKRWR